MTFPGSNCLTNHHLTGTFSVLRARYPAHRNSTIVPGASCAPYFLEVEIYDHRIWLYCIKVGVTLEDFADILKHTSKTLLCRSHSRYHRQDLWVCFPASSDTSLCEQQNRAEEHCAALKQGLKTVFVSSSLTSGKCILLIIIMSLHFTAWQ